MSKKKFAPWKPGDLIEAARLNEIQRVAERVDNESVDGGGVYSDSFTAKRGGVQPRIKFVRMVETIGPAQDIDNQWYDRDGVVQVWNPSANDFEDTDETVRIVVDPEGGHIADKDQIVPCIAHQGKLVAINWTTVRHAITCGDEHNKYPSRDKTPCVFPIKFLKITYAEQLNQQDYSWWYLYPARSYNDDWVCNIASGRSVYIPRNTIIWVYRVTGQWFTYVEIPPEEPPTQETDSWSSVSEVPSESSNSDSWSWSDQSLEVESWSSQSSGSISSSFESSSSSSVSRSLSSASSSSSGYDCVEFVTCLEFNAEICELTYETVQVCFPKILGITMYPGTSTGC